MRITEHIALVASGRLGFGLTNPYDCNVYAVGSEDEYVLIDAGSGLADDRIVARLASAGVSPDRVAAILLTHSHADHAAGAATLRDRLGARVHAPRASASAMRAGDDRASHLEAARAAGNYPADFRYPVIEVDAEVRDGDRITVGQLTIQALDSPGHAYDHTTYLLSRPGQPPVLFSGDLMLTDGRVLLQATGDCRLDLYATTMKRLASLGVAGLMPGHGAFTLTDGGAVLIEAAAQFATLVPPPSVR